MPAWSIDQAAETHSNARVALVVLLAVIVIKGSRSKALSHSSVPPKEK
jgi:hypothetical protein